MIKKRNGKWGQEMGSDPISTLPPCLRRPSRRMGLLKRRGAWVILSMLNVSIWSPKKELRLLLPNNMRLDSGLQIQQLVFSKRLGGV